MSQSVCVCGDIMWMCVCIYMVISCGYVCACTHVCVCLCMCVCICVFVHACVWVCVFVHECICVAVCVCRISVVEDEIPADMRAEAKDRRQEMIGKNITPSSRVRRHRTPLG